MRQDHDQVKKSAQAGFQCKSWEDPGQNVSLNAVPEPAGRGYVGGEKV